MKENENPSAFRKCDTAERVCFYEQEFYVLSNFSAFRVIWKGENFDTLEHAYHWEKFPDSPHIRMLILNSASAHEAFQIAQQNRHHQRSDWNNAKLTIMRDLLLAKVSQHEYVKRKLLETGDRQLVEDSWRDDFWGWGPKRNGKNALGNLWMEVRAMLRARKEQP